VDVEETNEDITFVTGDPEFDSIEKRLSEGTISDEELVDVLTSWTGGKKEEKKSEPILVEDIGEGFDDNFV
jgi:hypothetical protein